MHNGFIGPWFIAHALLVDFNSMSHRCMANQYVVWDKYTLAITACFQPELPPQEWTYFWKKTCGEHYNIEEWAKYEHREILPPNTPQNQQGPPPVVTVLMPNLARFRHPRLMGIHLASVQINSICSWGVKQWEWEKKRLVHEATGSSFIFVLKGSFHLKNGLAHTEMFK